MINRDAWLQIWWQLFLHIFYLIEEQHSRCFGLRWMPNEAADIDWKWIKEALASDEITKVKLLSFVTSLTLGSYVQEVYQLFNTLSTPMQERCNLMSLPDVFKGDIPQVWYLITYDKLCDIFETYQRWVKGAASA